MTPTGSTRTRPWLVLAVSLAFVAGVVSVSRSAEPAPRASGTDAGLAVRIDPETGTYTMPVVPEARQGGATAADELVITPGTSPAGGFKATRPSEPRPEKAPK